MEWRSHLMEWRSHLLGVPSYWAFAKWRWGQKVARNPAPQDAKVEAAGLPNDRFGHQN